MGFHIKFKLFNVAPFVFHKAPKTWKYLGTRGTHHFWVNFFPRCLQFSFKGFNIWMGCWASFLLQNGPNPKVHWVQIGWRRGPYFLLPKPFKIGLAPMLDCFGCVGGCPILLKRNSFLSHCFLNPGNDFFCPTSDNR